MILLSTSAGRYLIINLVESQCGSLYTLYLCTIVQIVGLGLKGVKNL